MKGNVYTLVYSAILGTACALLLTAAATFTKPYQDANKEAEEMLNILTALKVPFDEGATAKQLIEIYEANIKEQDASDELTYYEYRPASGSLEAVAVRFAGPGLWAPVKGFLAMEADKRTIRGITFYEQEETPGLGGDIVTDKFRNQFAGKSIVDSSGAAGIVIGVGKQTQDNGVDGITGATMTCDKVQQMINEVLTMIVEEGK
ncbi:MAG: FMN-binding protein [Planctomycetes bacterium]|nr:FMN-binding protein [Planctomycetota bacterium]